MQLKNLECQLAMAQLKRYKAGAKLSDEALEALESHLVECTDCQLLVQTQAQAQSTTPRTEAVPTHAVVESPAPTASQPQLEPSAKKPSLKMRWQGNGKTLALSATLAGLLIGMSSLANDPTRLFGDRALNPGQKPSQVKVNTSSQSAKPTVTPAAEAPAVELVAQNDPAPAVATAAPEPAEPAVGAQPRRQVTTRPVRQRVTRTVPRRTTSSRPTRATPRPAPANTGIRVYDENGNLVR